MSAPNRARRAPIFHPLQLHCRGARALQFPAVPASLHATVQAYKSTCETTTENRPATRTSRSGSRHTGKSFRPCSATSSGSSARRRATALPSHQRAESPTPRDAPLPSHQRDERQGDSGREQAPARRVARNGLLSVSTPDARRWASAKLSAGSALPLPRRRSLARLPRAP
jgi:hypothetical protein